MSVKTHPIPEDRFGDYIALLASVDQMPLLPHAACCAFLLGSGARIGEALTVRMKDLFAADGTPLERVTRTLEKKRRKEVRMKDLFAPDGTPLEKKRGKVVRLTVAFPWEYIGAPLIEWRRWIQQHMASGPEDFLFCRRWSGEPMTRHALRRGNVRMLDQLGIPWRGVGLHGLRKTILRKILQDQLDQGKNWLEAVRYCQEYACHERIDTTIRYLADDQPTDNPAMMSRIFGGNPAQNG